MSVSELFFAAALMLAPPGAPIPPISSEEWPDLQIQLCQLGVELQILDKREADFLLVKREDLATDLKLLRQRYADLKDSPKVEDLNRFPNREEVNAMLSFNRNYRGKMEARMISEPHKADYYRGVIKETDELYQLWDSVREVRSDFYYVSVRRQSLSKLKERAGVAAFITGQLPPCVPTWRFQEVK
jgi:hypothetical protein